MVYSISCTKILSDWEINLEREKEFSKRNRNYQDIITSSFPADVYSFAPYLVCPFIPLRDELEVVQSVNHIAKAKLKLKAPKTQGGSSKVKVVRFKNDPIPSRWFAIKAPLLNRLERSFTAYYNNLKISTIIGSHPNFMKVNALFIKTIDNGIHKPYLVLEDCHGPKLCDVYSELQLKKAIHILIQLKKACMHIYDCKIIPYDFSDHNVLITQGNIVKLIDYDIWFEQEKGDKCDLLSSIYKRFYQMAKNLAKNLEIKWNFTEDMMLHSRSDLENVLKAIITKFETKFKIEKTKYHIIKLTQRMPHGKTQGGKRFRARKISIRNEILYAQKRLLQLELK